MTAKAGTLPLGGGGNLPADCIALASSITLRLAPVPLDLCDYVAT